MDAHYWINNFRFRPDISHMSSNCFMLMWTSQVDTCRNNKYPLERNSLLCRSFLPEDVEMQGEVLIVVFLK